MIPCYVDPNYIDHGFGLCLVIGAWSLLGGVLLIRRVRSSMPFSRTNCKEQDRD